LKPVDLIYANLPQLVGKLQLLYLRFDEQVEQVLDVPEHDPHFTSQSFKH